MPFLSSYRNEAVCDKHARKFTVLECISLLLKICALLLLLIFFRRFYIAIAVWCVSILVNIFKRRLIYKYVYAINDNTLTIFKEYNEEKTEEILSIKIDKDIKELTLGSFSDIKYYEHEQGNPITIKTLDSKIFTIMADDYFYALLDWNLRRKEK